MVGFATGTATLLGPAQWITASLRGSALSGIEDYAMIALILVYIVLSFLLSRLLTAVGGHGLDNLTVQVVAAATAALFL